MKLSPVVVRKTHAVIFLLGLLVAVGIFVLIELFGLDLRFPLWHTISFWSQEHAWLFFVILVLILAVSPVGAILWWEHIRRGRIPKEAGR